VELPAGIHTVGYDFEPDPIWLALSDGAWIALATLIVGAVIAFMRAGKT
jgi:hypothetical protein